MTALWALGSLLVTVLVYGLTKRLYRRYHLVLLSPLLITPLLLMILLRWLHVPYQTYMAGSHVLANLLGPATVAFAIPMHKHFGLLKKHAPELLAGVAAGSLVAVATSAPVARWLHLSTQMARSLAPHSVTTPVAMDIARATGGLPTMTAVFVIATGLFGLVAGQLVIRLLPIHTAVAKGALFGMGAHGAGTSKAFEIGVEEGTVASLVMIIAAAVTILITPALLPLLAP